MTTPSTGTAAMRRRSPISLPRTANGADPRRFSRAGRRSGSTSSRVPGGLQKRTCSCRRRSRSPQSISTVNRNPVDRSVKRQEIAVVRNQGHAGRFECRGDLYRIRQADSRARSYSRCAMRDVCRQFHEPPGRRCGQCVPIVLRQFFVSGAQRTGENLRQRHGGDYQFVIGCLRARGRSPMSIRARSSRNPLMNSPASP